MAPVLKVRPGVYVPRQTNPNVMPPQVAVEHGKPRSAASSSCGVKENVLCNWGWCGLQWGLCGRAWLTLVAGGGAAGESPKHTTRPAQ